MRLFKAVIRSPLWIATHTLFWFVDKAIEWFLYPAVILAYGLEAGAGLMMLLSFFYCWGLLVAYDRLSSTWWRDIFGFETAKKGGLRTLAWVRRRLGSKYYRSVQKSLPFRVARILVIGFGFLAINAWQDPMTYVILTRPLNRYGMGKREWAIFISSVVASCTLWALGVYLGLETVREFDPELMDWLTSWSRALLPGV